ncbi:MAG: hypothetical protein Kow0073_02580 [Immundisolibacter sp.]
MTHGAGCAGCSDFRFAGRAVSPPAVAECAVAGRLRQCSTAAATGTAAGATAAGTAHAAATGAKGAAASGAAAGAGQIAVRTTAIRTAGACRHAAGAAGGHRLPAGDGRSADRRR